MGQLFIFLFDEEWENIVKLLETQNKEEGLNTAHKIKEQTGLY